MCVLYWFILQLVRAYKWLSQPLTIFTERKLSVKHIGLQMWSHAHRNQYIGVRLRTPAQNSARELRPQKESMWCHWTENIYSRQRTNIRTERELQSHCSNQCAQSISLALKSSAQWFTVLGVCTVVLIWTTIDYIHFNVLNKYAGIWYAQTILNDSLFLATAAAAVVVVVVVIVVDVDFLFLFRCFGSFYL